MKKILFLLCLMPLMLAGQDRVGINNLQPARTLHVLGDGLFSNGAAVGSEPDTGSLTIVDDLQWQLSMDGNDIQTWDPLFESSSVLNLQRFGGNLNVGLGDLVVTNTTGDVSVGRNLLINGSQECKGELNINKTNVALRVFGDEALWSDGTYFSWGYGAAYNYFKQDIKIGGGGTPAPISELHIEDTGDASMTIESTGTGSDAFIQLTDNAVNATNGWTIRRDDSEGGRLKWLQNGVTQMVLTNDGCLGIGVNTPSSCLHVDGTIRAEGINMGDYANMQYNPDGGVFYYDNSSRRYKENIENLDANFFAILNARPVKYTRPGKPDRIEVGYIAEEMEALGLRHLIGFDKNGLVETFNYEKMILHVVEVIKHQDQDLRKKQSEIDELRIAMLEIEQRLKQLED